MIRRKRKVNKFFENKPNVEKLSARVYFFKEKCCYFADNCIQLKYNNIGLGDLCENRW